MEKTPKQQEEDEFKTYFIENKLFSLANLECPQTTPVTAKVVVENIGSWIVKLRKGGILVNDADLVFEDTADIASTLIFPSADIFWSCMSVEHPSKILTASSPITIDGSMDLATVILQLLLSSNPAHTIEKPRSRANSLIDTKPIKSGWLYKKREIISGWRYRYFTVYVGRVEYFIDQSCVVPRGVIPLLGAEVHGPKKCSINGSDDHWYLTIEPRHRDKAFKLSSDFTGEEGYMDITTWIQVFNIASRPAESPQGILGIPTPTPPPPSAPPTVIQSTSHQSSETPNAPNKVLLVTALIILCVAAWLGGGVVALLWMCAVVGVSGIAVVYISNADVE